MKTFHSAALLAVPLAALLAACTPNKPIAEAPRPVRTAEIQYDAVREANRYVGTVRARHEVDHLGIGGVLLGHQPETPQRQRERGIAVVRLAP